MKSQPAYNKLTLIVMLLVVMSTGAFALCETTIITKDDVRAFNLCAKGSICTTWSGPGIVKEGQQVTTGLYYVMDPQTTTETIRVEVGMYPKGSPQELRTLSTIIDSTFDAVPTRNCVENQPWVDTVQITTSNTLGEGIIDFTITAPTDAALNNGGSREYILQAVMYKNCYNECATTTGSLPITWTSKPFTLTDNPSLVGNTNNDGVQNGNETDIDCGGSSAQRCQNGYRCNTGADCNTGSVCQSLGSGLAPVCTVPQPEKFNIPALPIILGIAGSILLIVAFMRWRR